MSLEIYKKLLGILTDYTELFLIRKMKILFCVLAEFWGRGLSLPTCAARGENSDCISSWPRTLTCKCATGDEIKEVLQECLVFQDS